MRGEVLVLFLPSPENDPSIPSLSQRADSRAPKAPPTTAGYTVWERDSMARLHIRLAMLAGRRGGCPSCVVEVGLSRCSLHVSFPYHPQAAFHLKAWHSVSLTYTGQLRAEG